MRRIGLAGFAAAITGLALMAVMSVWFYGGEIGQRVFIRDCMNLGGFTFEGKTYKCEKL